MVLEVSGVMAASCEMCVSMSTQQTAIFGDKSLARRELNMDIARFRDV